MPILNPEILSWARETAGLSLAQAADVIGIKESRGRTGAERLAALEAGNENVSRSQLVRMTKVYRRSLLVFYLEHPPAKGDRGQDFRTVPGSEPPLYSPTLDALIRDIKGRQSTMKSLREDSETEKLSFVGSANMSSAAESLSERIIQKIGFNLGEFRGQSSIENAFTYLRSKIEESGIFVLLVGNLGSHHTDISVETFRGYAIADEIAPVVVINDHDAKPAWAFTALHEVAHLWLGTTGISGFRPEVKIEQYCNRVAGEILLPSSEHDILSRLRVNSVTELIDDISAFARDRKISRAMVAYKLLQLDLIGRTTWNELTEQFRKAWLASQERDVLETDRRGGGPNYYVVKRHRLGKALLGLVTRSLVEGLITPTKAGLLLGVKPRNVDPLVFGDRPARGGR
jgi:Zn-dependent peptidase ImmA (M78 family)/transcriptional regulator with XRE-family HTH domain